MVRENVDILINFTLSKTHLMYVEAFLHNLKLKNIQINKIFVRQSKGKFYAFSGVTNEDYNYFLGSAWIPVDDNQRKIKLFDYLMRKGAGKKLYYLHIGYLNHESILSTDMLLSYKIVHNIIIPEGIGSSGNLLTKLSATKLELPNIKLRKFFKKELRNNLICDLFLKKSKFLLFDVKSNINPMIKEYVLYKNKNYVHMENHLIKKVLFLSQPFVEMNVISKDDYILIIKKLGSELDRIGYSLIVRPHPAEYINKYDGIANLDTDFSLPIELLVSSPYTIIGFFSTSQINLAAIYGMKTYSLFDERISNYYKSKMQENILNRYCGKAKTIEQISLSLQRDL